MKVSFYLRKEKINKNGKVPISLLVTYNGNKFRRNIKDVKTKLIDWDLRKERVKPNKSKEEYNFHVEYNNKLDELEYKIKELFRFSHLQNIPLTKELIIETIDSDNSNTDLFINFFKCFDEFIDTNKSVKAERTIKGYITTRNFLKEFENHSNYTLSFEKINLEFIDKFSAFAFELKNTYNNYYSKLISIIKTFMKWSEERGYHNNTTYVKFKAKENDTEVIYLSYEELMRLYNHNFKSDKLNRVRDVYCFGCFTGLRFSDIKDLKEQYIKKDHIDLTIKKTKSIGHIIPLIEPAKKILEKYSDTIYYPLPVISSQKNNKYLKECCKEVDIDTPVTITRYIGQRKVEKTEPKYNFITSHTARKTFITNSLLLGMNERVLRSITGHKREATFNKYVKLTEEFKKFELNNAWNFDDKN